MLENKGDIKDDIEGGDKIEGRDEIEERIERKYDRLKLEDQVIFPVYACSKELLRLTRPILKKINLTFTQYIVMVLLWSEENDNFTKMGKKIYLDSGTLTPVVDHLEEKGYLIRKKRFLDERNTYIELTEKGKALKELATPIPAELTEFTGLSYEEIETLCGLLFKVLDHIEK